MVLEYYVQKSEIMVEPIVPTQVSRGLIDTLGNLMTPMAILKQPYHEGRIITLAEFPNFEALRKKRGLIRDLQLVPKRSDEVQAEYERMSRDDFITIIEKYYLKDVSMAWVKEIFPTDLPGDVEQHVVWFKKGKTKEEVAEFIAKHLTAKGLTDEDVIMFERSRATNTPFVAAAIPEYRHIHVWTRKQL